MAEKEGFIGWAAFVWDKVRGKARQKKGTGKGREGKGTERNNVVYPATSASTWR